MKIKYIPILNAPAWIPPTVAGPITTLFNFLAIAIKRLASLIGTPSAIITTYKIKIISINKLTFKYKLI